MTKKFKIKLYYTILSSLRSHVFEISEKTTLSLFFSNNRSFFDNKKFNLNDHKIGVYGKIKKDSYVIQENDRIEVYNKTFLDPKVRRKRIAEKKK